MFRKWMLVIAALSVSACASNYVAEEYPLENERIASFAVKGNVTVSNQYTASKPITVGPLDADLKQITQVFADQLGKEIEENGNKTGGGNKSIAVKVTDAGYANRFVYQEGRINVELELGNGELIKFEKRNGSPAGFYRAMNGAIAQTVIEALEHDKVKAYLAQ